MRGCVCVCVCRYVRIDLFVYIAGDSRGTNTKVVHDVPGMCDQKKFQINMCPILNAYGVTGRFKVENKNS